MLHPRINQRIMRFFLGCLLFCFISGLSNDTEEEFIPAPVFNLTGNWALAATRVSPGGAVGWSPNTHNESYTFQIDGTFILVSEFLEEGTLSGSYTADANRTTLVCASNDGSTETQPYGYQLTRNELVLYGIGCTEECSYRHKRRQ